MFHRNYFLFMKQWKANSRCHSRYRHFYISGVKCYFYGGLVQLGSQLRDRLVGFIKCTTVIEYFTIECLLWLKGFSLLIFLYSRRAFRTIWVHMASFSLSLSLSLSLSIFLARSRHRRSLAGALIDHIRLKGSSMAVRIRIGWIDFRKIRYVYRRDIKCCGWV